jgi:hypothetical protein
MKSSIYIPDKLRDEVQEYLKDHPDLTLSSLIQQALEARIRPRPNTMLALAGFINSGGGKQRTEEQMREDVAQRPEDEPVKRGFDRL